MKLTRQEQITQSTTCWMLNCLWAVIIIVAIYHEDLKKENKSNTAKHETVLSK